MTRTSILAAEFIIISFEIWKWFIHIIDYIDGNFRPNHFVPESVLQKNAAGAAMFTCNGEYDKDRFYLYKIAYMYVIHARPVPYL